MIRRVVGLFLAVFWCACTASPVAPEKSASTSAALTAPPQLPVPCQSNGSGGWASLWEGSIPQLYFADAIAECSASPSGGYEDVDLLDAYSVITELYMEDASAAPLGQMAAWAKLRQAAASNCDQGLSTNMQSVPFQPHVVPETVTYTSETSPQYYADIDLKTAGVNLCVAQLLSQLMPGTAGGEALLFSDAEQRELLETIRERSQIAMLQYALLGEAFAIPTPSTLSTPTDPQQRLPLLNAWARSAASATLTSMGQDFAAAVQLHATVSQELGSLFARSRSARLPRSAASLSIADDQWGTGSWFQRDMAMMFGGDPLAIVSSLANGLPQGPGAWVDPAQEQVPGTVWQNTWPSFPQSPYIQDRLASPQVLELLSMASGFDVIDLQAPTALDPTPPCGAFDATNTANYIYSQVEYQLELSACSAQHTKCPAQAPTVPSDGDLSGWLLATDYNITPSHAVTLGQYLVEALSLPPSSTGYCGGADNTPDSVDSFPGAFVVGGADAESRPTFDPTTGHLSPQATLNPRSLAQLGPGYGRSQALRFPTPTEMATAPWADVGSYGFDGLCFPNQSGTGACYWGLGSLFSYEQGEAKRTLGSLGAAAAVREMLLDTVSYLGTSGANTALQATYLAHASGIIGVLDGEAGPGVSLRPAVAVTNMTETTSSGATVTLPVLEGAYQNLSICKGCLPINTPLPLWNVTVTVDSSDAWWNAGGATFSVYALQDPYASDLALHPESSVGVKTVASLVTGLYGAPGTELASADPRLTRWQFTLPIPPGSTASLTVTSKLTAVAARTLNGVTTYRLLAGNLDLIETLPNAVTGGQYYAGSGSLGTSMQHQATPYAFNPQEPAYDGFDLPNHWIPPFNAALLGGAPSDPSAPPYLQLAQTAAGNAAMAVNTALTDMQQEEMDIASAQAAAVAAGAQIQASRDTVCGIGNQQCDLVVRAEQLNSALFPNVPASQSCAGGDVNCALSNLVAGVVGGLTQGTYYVADAVDQHMLDTSPPTYVTYNGGTLQSALITQWGAIHDASGKVSAILSALSAAQSQITAAATVLSGISKNTAYDCSSAAMQTAVNDCTTNSMSVGVSAGFPGGASVSVSSSTSYNPAPLDAQLAKCQSETNTLGGANATAASAVATAVASVSSALQTVADAETAIVQSSATIQTLLNQGSIADAQATLEAELSATTLQTSTGLWREYTSADAFRAMALLNGARQYALAARRAIEAEYVVDLSTMSANEAFVASPSTWANDVYTYDLSMPSAVGLQVGSGSGGTYSNQVVDYVNNLQAFIAGYAVNRPTAVAQNEIDVAMLPGLAPGAPAESGTTNYYLSTAAWQLHCPPDPSNNMQGAWIGPVPTSTTGDVDGACTVMGQSAKPDAVKVDFTLDPWGRIYGDVDSPPFVDRYNARWGQLAVNFVGTGIQNCALAANPQVCYNDQWITYDLTQTGPSWITDYTEVWNLMATPTTTIEGGKGLAAELWLDPLQDGWSNQYISAIARTEFELSPLGGAYELYFQVPPEVVLSNIQGIQLMIGSTAWVAQQQ